MVACNLRFMSYRLSFRARAARHHEVADRDLHRLAVLVQRGGTKLHHALVRARLRWPHFHDFGFDAQLVAGPNRPRPAEFIEARTDDAADGLYLAFDEQAHGHRRSVPAARRQPAEDRVARRRLVEVEGLRVE